MVRHEELGLKGSWSYIEKHADELKRHRFMVNVDVAGGIIGNNNAPGHGHREGRQLPRRNGQGARDSLGAGYPSTSGDCIPLGHKGVPSVTFAAAEGAGRSTPMRHVGRHRCSPRAMLGTSSSTSPARWPTPQSSRSPGRLADSIKKQTKEYIENSGKVLEQ